MPIIISPAVLAKLQNKTPQVTKREVEQCFENKSGRLLRDTREKHRTDPPTLWFIAKTNQNRALKIVYIQIGADVHLKSAFEPNADEIFIYGKYGSRTL